MKMKNFPVVMCAVVLAGVLSATTFEPQGTTAKKSDKQQSEKDKSKDKAKSDSAKDENAPKPLFQGNLGIKSSRQGKDSAALGFNGLDPEGKIEKAALDAPVTKIDVVNAASLVAYNPTADELKQFMSEGNLKAGPGPTAKEEKKKK